MSEDRWQMVEVSGALNVPFKWRDDTPGGGNLGHAEFQVCLKHHGKRKSSEFWVYPRQQRGASVYWHKDWVHPDLGFSLSSYQDLEDPNVWHLGYCEEHRCTTFAIYVPRDSVFARIDGYGLSFWKTDVH